MPQSPETLLHPPAPPEGYSCYLPQRDVVAVPQDARMGEWAARSSEMSLDQVLQQKKT